MIGDHYSEKFRDTVIVPSIWPSPQTSFNWPMPSVTREEFDALKRDVEEMKALLVRAKAYDERNGEPDCEMDEKVALLKAVAKMVGVDLGDIWPEARK